VFESHALRWYSAFPPQERTETLTDDRRDLGLWITSEAGQTANSVRDMPREHPNNLIGVDANGCLTERIHLGGQDVIVHYDDIPDSDITSVHGIRCTTPLRTVIDIAPEMSGAELERIVRDCLDRRLFSREEALARTAEPDMLSRRGAQLLRQMVLR
jgi:hypothetical protein